jgi:hypothetical protein
VFTAFYGDEVEHELRSAVRLLQNVRDLAARHARTHRTWCRDVACQMRRTDCIHYAFSFPPALVTSIT